MTNDNRDWRESAYLTKENWPEAIPPMGPKREYGPYPWSEKTHDDPHDVDDYPSTHPDAASVGNAFIGDVCPYCGVPLRWDEDVVLITGDRGTFHEVDDLDDPTPAYHPECWRDRKAEINAKENRSLTDYNEVRTDGGLPHLGGGATPLHTDAASDDGGLFHADADCHRLDRVACVRRLTLAFVLTDRDAWRPCESCTVGWDTLKKLWRGEWS